MTTTSANVEHAVLGRDAWIEAQRTHLVREKELTRLRDELSAERRALPWLEITEPYEFDGPTSSTALPVQTRAPRRPCSTSSRAVASS